MVLAALVLTAAASVALLRSPDGSSRTTRDGATSPTQVEQVTLGGTSSDAAAELADLVNQYREERGLARLPLDPDLTAAAMLKSR